MSGCYRSVPSHDLDYHVERRHHFIGITVRDRDLAVWAATRFRRMHADHVWQEMMHHCGAHSLDQYAQVLLDFGHRVLDHTANTIDLADILRGAALDDLEALIDHPVNRSFYHEWKQQQ